MIDNHDFNDDNYKNDADDDNNNVTDINFIFITIL